MFKNYIKIAFRSLLRGKAHSLINILGLSLGIGVCILIVLFVRDEWTFDKFHKNADRIYRVYAREDWGSPRSATGSPSAGAGGTGSPRSGARAASAITSST